MKKVLRIVCIVGIVGGLIMFCFGLGFYVTSSEPAEQDYSIVHGLFLRASEKQGVRTPALDIYLQDDPLRYRVPIDVYGNGFRKDLFLEHCRPGTHLALAVRYEDLKSPFRPPGDPQDTVFVAAVRDTQHEYYSLHERIEWLKQNTQMAPVIAAIGAVIAIGLGLALKFI